MTAGHNGIGVVLRCLVIVAMSHECGCTGQRPSDRGFAMVPAGVLIPYDEWRVDLIDFEPASMAEAEALLDRPMADPNGIPASAGFLEGLALQIGREVAWVPYDQKPNGVHDCPYKDVVEAFGDHQGNGEKISIGQALSGVVSNMSNEYRSDFIWTIMITKRYVLVLHIPMPHGVPPRGRS